MEKVLYVELTPEEFEQRLFKAPIGYLPLGTLEWHGRHMPLGADGLISSGFFVELAKKVGGIVLPMLFLGTDSSKTIDENHYYGMDINSFPSNDPQQLTGSAYWIHNRTFKELLHAILVQLKRAGFKIIVAHGHSPSTVQFYKYSKKWRKELGLDLLTCWRDSETDGMGIQTDHAAANETSLMMALRTDLVKIDNLPKDKNKHPLGLMGDDPREFASVEQGRKIIDLNLARMEQLLMQKLAKIGK